MNRLLERHSRTAGRYRAAVRQAAAVDARAQAALAPVQDCRFHRYAKRELEDLEDWQFGFHRVSGTLLVML